MKHRIIKRGDSYWVQFRVLFFFWVDTGWAYPSLEAARKGKISREKYDERMYGKFEVIE